MKIGIIYTAFNTEEYLEKSLKPWEDAREQELDGHRFFIGAASVPFEKFDGAITDNTQKLLNLKFENGEIDSIWVKSEPQTELIARGEILNGMRDQHQVDIVWQVDSDEFYTLAEISRIIKFIEKQQFVPAFRLCLKNFIFDEKHYLTEPFTPMRIHRVKFGPNVAKTFWADNNVMYDNEGTDVRDINMATLTVPKAISWTKHLTWLSNERSRKKIEYQCRRWPACSYKWNDEKHTLEFNLEYYSQRGLALPEIAEVENPA